MLWAGVKGEKQSAYHIDFVLKDSPNWAVIHDLRIELNGRVAQIDHILINRFLEIYVIESKSFRTKIRYANGGWERLNSSNYWEGIESPVEQNENHIFVLKDLIDTHQLAPTRFGLSPNFINIVSVQGSCSGGNGETSFGDSLKESRLPPNESLERDEQISQVKKALAEMPEELRTPLVLVEYEEMSQVEIATALNCHAEGRGELTLLLHGRNAEVKAQRKLSISAKPPMKHVYFSMSARTAR